MKTIPDPSGLSRSNSIGSPWRLNDHSMGRELALVDVYLSILMHESCIRIIPLDCHMKTMHKWHQQRTSEVKAKRIEIIQDAHALIGRPVKREIEGWFKANRQPPVTSR
ncbi:unnamed protein product [Dovyalis caffra]|uniref:Uncharacterized protein n=1 Tax=Dovyalis caffra TaxID=77055 RepID=A0AAV1QYS9_9ROSI|nr:unnamed protein product [Dovyalis caffra]